MKFAPSLIRAATRMLDIEVALLDTKSGVLSDEQSNMVLDTHARAMKRIEDALPQGADINALLQVAQTRLEHERTERARGLKERKKRQRERIMEKQMMLG